MADTLEDFIVGTTDWVDVYTVTGITVGSTIVVCNKGGSNIVIAIKGTKPSASNTSGQMLGTVSTGDYQALIDGSPTGVWLKSSGSSGSVVNVQEA